MEINRNMPIKIYAFWIALSFCLFLTACSDSGSSLNVEDNQETHLPATVVESPSTYEPTEEQILEYPLNGYIVWPSNTPDYSEGLSWAYYDNEYGERIYSAIDNTGLAALTLPENYGEHIVQAPQNFENGVAIILTRSAYSNNEGFMLIDRNGNLLRASDEAWPTTITGFIDDVAIVRVDIDCDGTYNSDYDSFYIIDATGDVLYSHTSTPSENIFLIGYGNDHFVLMQRRASFSTNEIVIGSIDKYGNTLHEFSTANGVYTEFALFSTSTFEKYVVLYSGDFRGTESYLYDTASGELKPLDKNDGTLFNLEGQSQYVDGYFENGYAYYRSSGGYNQADLFYKVTADMLGQKVKYLAIPDGAIRLPFEPQHNFYSDGLIWGNDRKLGGNEGFYDKDGNLIFNVSTDNNATYGSFYNGYASVLLLGADHNWYVTIIDKTGTQQYEPIKVTEEFVGGSSIVTYQSAGFMKVLIGERDGSLLYLDNAIWPFGEGVYINPNGELVTIGADDFSVFSDGDFPEIDVYNGVLVYSNNLYINLKTNESFDTIRVPNT